MIRELRLTSGRWYHTGLVGAGSIAGIIICWLLVSAHLQSHEQKSREIRARSKCVEIKFLRCHEVLLVIGMCAPAIASAKITRETRAQWSVAAGDEGGGSQASACGARASKEDVAVLVGDGRFAGVERRRDPASAKVATAMSGLLRPGWMKHCRAMCGRNGTLIDAVCVALRRAPLERTTVGPSEHSETPETR